MSKVHFENNSAVPSNSWAAGGAVLFTGGWVASKNYLGINKFNLLSYSSKVSVLALGGINQNNMRKLKMLHINGFGGIRIFKKKPAYKRPVFLKNNFF